jgi:hypothetical protein
VQITYQDGPVSEGGTGQTIYVLYDGAALSNNPGYVNITSVQNGAVIGHPGNPNPPPPFTPGVQPLPVKLTDATVTVDIWLRDGNNATNNGQPIPVHLRTDAVAEQGRVSYLDLPYNFTQINGQPVGDLKLRGLPLVPTPALVSPGPTGGQGAAPSPNLAAPGGSPLPLTANQRFVASAFRGLTGQAIDPLTLARDASLLDHGVSRLRVVRAIEHLLPSRFHLIQNLYHTLLHRDPRLGELGRALRLLAHRGALQPLEAGLLASPEYFSVRGSGTPGGFLRAVAGDVFKRHSLPFPLSPVDEALLGGEGARLALVTELLRTAAADRAEAQDLYSLVNLPATRRGLRAAAALLELGSSGGEVLARIVASDAYFAQAQTPLGAVPLV